MKNYRFLKAMINLSVQEVSGHTPPPKRKRPLEFEMELNAALALKGDFYQLCQDLVDLPQFQEVNMDGARQVLIAEFRRLLKLRSADQVVLNGGSIPTYRKLPDGSHWTEDWLQIESGGATTPLAISSPATSPQHVIYPCLRVLIEET